MKYSMKCINFVCCIFSHDEVTFARRDGNEDTDLPKLSKSSAACSSGRFDWLYGSTTLIFQFFLIFIVFHF